MLLTLLAVATLAMPQGGELTPGSLDAWRDYLAPEESELVWRSIGWRADLWSGVEEAQRERKPVLLWAMNGHPLGCT